MDQFTIDELLDDCEYDLNESKKLYMEYKIAVKTNLESMGIRNHFYN